MSNLKLQKQNKNVIIENAKKALMIQCYDDICDIYQDNKNKINTIYTFLLNNSSSNISNSNTSNNNASNSNILENEIDKIFIKTREFLYDNLYNSSPILCRTLMYLNMHIETFLIYKNSKYLSKNYVTKFYENKYYNEELFNVLKIDLFSSTNVLVNIMKDFIK